MNSPNFSDKNHPMLCFENPWKSTDNLIWIGSTMTLLRNLEKFNFPSKLPTDKRKQIVSLLSKGILSTKLLNQPKLIRAEDMPPIEKEFLVEHFLSNQSFHQAYVGEAFILDNTGSFLALINLKDHLLLQVIDAKDDFEATLDRLVQLELELNNTVAFAFSPKFGFLTSDPTHCGSAFVATIYLHLPGLIYTNKLEEIVQKIKDDSIEQTGFQGDPKELIGDIVAFHNAYTLGITEETILSALRTLATKLIVEEKGIRSFLRKGNEHDVAEIKNKVSRAYAILMHSYQIEAVEALEAISLIKLGIDLEWLRGISQSVLNQLLFDCRRAHLLCHFGEKVSQEEIPHRRAEYIHQSLHGLELLIQ